MSGSSNSHPESGIQHLRRVVDAGASGAAEALAELVGRSVFDATGPWEQRGVAGEEAPRDTGVFFEVEGHLRGLFALLLTPASRDTMLRSLVSGGVEGDPESEAAASALCEIGNIVASHTISAVADTFGARVLLSVPKLVASDAEGALERWVAERRRRGPVLLLESVLFECDRAFEALLVFAIDP